jgi:ribosome-associated protein
MTTVLSVPPSIEIPLSEFEFSFARSGGPGGQNVNKVSSKAILRWRVADSESLPPDVLFRFLNKYNSRLTTEGDLVLSSQRFRDQPGNIQDCLDKLTEMIASVAIPPVQRKATRPTLASKVRRVETKQVNAKKKQQRQRPRFDD